MKLYNDDSSPFASRVRVALYHKRLDVEICAPPGGPRSDEYRRINPLGLIPALDTGEVLVSESLAILEYLEDRFPEPAMRPGDAEGRALMRRIVLYHDHVVQPALRTLFGLLMSGSPERADVEQGADRLRDALARLQSVLGTGSYACGDGLGLADCALVPTAYYTRQLMAMLDAGPMIETLDRMALWWEQVQSEPAVERVLAEVDKAFNALAAAQRSS